MKTKPKVTKACDVEIAIMEGKKDNLLLEVTYASTLMQ